MKKLILVFMVLFASMTFAFPACVDLGLLSIEEPADGFSLYETQSFTFEARAVSSDIFSLGSCTVEITFEYDEGTGGASFDRIKDPSPYNPGTDYLESLVDFTVQTGDITTVAGVVIPITVTCNNSGDYDLRLSSPSGGGGAGTESSVIAIHCLPLANSPPSGQFLTPAFDTVLYKKDDGTGAPDSFVYTIKWEESDAENDSLEYDLRIFRDGSLFDSDSGLLAKTYDATINAFGEFTFEVDLKDVVHGNQTTIYSKSVFVKDQNFSTLSIADLNLFPEVIYGDGTIFVTVEVRNNSPYTVDINAVFFNDGFPGGSYSYSFSECPMCAEKNVPPFSKVKLSIPVTGHTFMDLSPGDYNVGVVVKDFLPGSSAERNTVKSYAYFIVLDETKAISASETNLIAVLLVSFAVLLITRKKNN